MAMDIEDFENSRKKYEKTPKTKPIKIYVYDQKLKKKRIVQLDDLLDAINAGKFDDVNTTFFYRTAYERDIDFRKDFEKGINIDL